MRKFLSKKNDYYVYLIDNEYIVQYDSGDHASTIYQFTITKEIYLDLQETLEEVKDYYKKFDRATMKKYNMAESLENFRGPDQIYF